MPSDFDTRGKRILTTENGENTDSLMATPTTESTFQYPFQFAYPGYSLSVSNIDNRLTYELFGELLQKFFPSNVIMYKYFEESGTGEKHCCILFSDHQIAASALNILNGRQVYDKKLRVAWACAPTSIRQPSFSDQDGYSVYVGDLGADIEEEHLKEAFKKFGEVKNARIVRDMDTGMSKGYGFVVFSTNAEAENAISKMNGNILGTRPVKVSRASRNKSGQAPAPLSYNDVYRQASEGNTTIYVGNLPGSMDDHAVKEFFRTYGQVQEVKYFQDKRYGFIRFDTHEAAATAIVSCNGKIVDKSMMKCWWSKESAVGSLASATNLVPAQSNPQPIGYGHNPYAPPSAYPYYPNSGYYGSGDQSYPGQYRSSQH